MHNQHSEHSGYQEKEKVSTSMIVHQLLFQYVLQYDVQLFSDYSPSKVIDLFLTNKENISDILGTTNFYIADKKNQIIFLYYLLYVFVFIWGYIFFLFLT